MTANHLADIVARDLRILLVAINPAPPSLSSGMHLATPTNAFWKLLAASKLTPRLYAPSESSLLLRDRIGLTSLVTRATRTAAELSIRERREGALVLAKTVERWEPRIVALLGLTLFPIVFPEANESGPGLKLITLGRSRVFVLPNPSGRNRAYPGLAGKLPWYEALADCAREQSMAIRIKRAYVPAARTDGYRVLVDRLWPRGLSKDDAKIDEWSKELAPSDALRRWFGHEPSRFPEFRKRYEKELTTDPARAALAALAKRASAKTVTLVYAAKDEEHNNAIVLTSILERMK